MDKTIIKKQLDKLVAEASVSGAKVTKRAQKASKEENDAYYKDVESKMKEYGKNLEQEDENAIEPKKTNVEGDTKEYHEDMEIMNGQEMIQYDIDPSENFKDRAKKAIEGDSTMGNKTYTGDENGNTEPVWGASDAEFGKKLVARANASKEKRNDQTGTFNQFGDDIEMSPKAPRIKKRKIATEGMKRLRFKKEFDGVGNALKLIPETFKVADKVFEMTDGKESYKIKWEGTLDEGKAVVLEGSSKGFMNEAFMKIKHLMNYNAEDTLGTPTSNERVKANKTLAEGLKNK